MPSPHGLRLALQRSPKATSVDRSTAVGGIGTMFSQRSHARCSPKDDHRRSGQNGASGPSARLALDAVATRPGWYSVDD